VIGSPKHILTTFAGSIFPISFIYFPLPQASLNMAIGITETLFLFANFIPRELNEAGSKFNDLVF